MPSPTARLLVVDDSRSTRAALSHYLEERGYRVVGVGSGEEALEALANQKFDLVLLDVVMRGMSGLDALERIRGRYSKLELPVLMATARVDSQDVVAALDRGADDYVTKPIDFPVALARIESQLRLRHQAASLKSQTIALGADGGIPVGTVLDGRYELLDVLGVGGFAIVYRARQMSTGQTVAVKVLKAHRAIASGRSTIEHARFRREMSLIGELRHPHVVRLIDSGWLEVEPEEPQILQSKDATQTSASGSRSTGTQSMRTSSTAFVPPHDAEDDNATRIPFIVMEYLEGESLYQVLEVRGQLDARETADLLVPVASALWAAHRKGIIHRDLKPGNIFLARTSDDDVTPMVLDFGVAKLIGDVDNDLTDDVMIGTPGWWSPEQARGGTQLDPRSDEYQLGALIYRCVTGRKPFEGKGVQLVHAIAAGRFRPLSTYRTDLPSEFEAIVAKMMARAPAARYPTLRDVGRALLPFASPRVRRRWEPRFEDDLDAPLIDEK